MLLIESLGQKSTYNIVVSHHCNSAVLFTVLTQEFLYLIAATPQLLSSLVYDLVFEEIQYFGLFFLVG